jgi:hypothetical protein
MLFFQRLVAKTRKRKKGDRDRARERNWEVGEEEGSQFSSNFTFQIYPGPRGTATILSVAKRPMTLRSSNRWYTDKTNPGQKNPDRQTLDTTLPGHKKLWIRQTLDTTNPGHNKPWTRQTLDTPNPIQQTLDPTKPKHNKPWTQQTLYMTNSGWTRQTLDTINPGQDKPWTQQTLDNINSGHDKPWIQQTLDTTKPRHNKP